MSMRSLCRLSWLLPLAACGGSTAEFSAPRELSHEQRPTRWDTPDRQRLGVQDMAAPQKRSSTDFVATTPPGFAELPAQPQRFRDLLWRVGGDADAECYLTAFVGGSVEQNLQRWYGQMAAEPRPLASLPRVPVAGEQGYLLELTGDYNGKPDQGMLLAFLVRDGGVTTLKFTGPAPVVLGHRDGFLALAASLRPRGSSDASGAPASSAAATAVPAAAAGGSAQQGSAPHGSVPPPSHAQPFVAEVPAGWTLRPGSMRAMHHGFGSEGEVYVGQMGGQLRAMLDIWRGEVGLAELSDAEFQALPKLSLLGNDALWLDASGDFHSMSGKQIPQARVLVAACAEGGNILFVKLVGKASEVAAEEAGFRNFCTTLRRSQ